jgi:uncharacterized protein (AIM24 family)
MQSRITGTTMPVLEFILEPNESIISEAGELSWMGSSIQLTTHTQFGGGGGLFGVIKRVAGGGSIFMTEYRAIGTPGELAFATKLPGHIVPVEVSPGHDYMIHRQGFLCATPQIQIGVGFQQSLGAGIFGGPRASRTRRCLSSERLVSNHNGPWHQEYDLRWRWNLSGFSYWPGKNLAADAPHR